MYRCTAGLIIGALISVSLLVCGVTMLGFYHVDDRHANAEGVITNNDDCRYPCVNGGGCLGRGDVTVLYQYESGDPAGWFTGTLTAPGFCSYDCCAGYMAGNVSMYFYVEDGTVKYASVVPDFNLHVLLFFGVIVMLMGIIGLSMSGVAWRHTGHYQIVN